MTRTQASPVRSWTASTSVLSLRNVDVHRGEAHVLRDVSFEMPPNAVTALLGRNGAGKTTTLLAVVGLLAATGRMSMAGTDLKPLKVDERVRQGIGYVPEDREVFADLTVAENLRLAMRGPESQARLQQVHKLFPILHERAQQRAGTLSGGQQQMIAIARALLNDNKILLIDEPSKGLAPAVVTEVVQAIEQVKATTTILLVEQNLAVAARLADHALVLDQGRLVYSGPMEDFARDTEATSRWLGVDIRPKAVGGRGNE
ncbi:ABC transporter ATP-binding protein [Arthrobacter mobilis]|uniref:ABC transporter ATP-binding protein n=1 Tax=Arthrobacter mobilis TaxID=2724944 RepID=A0A7X6HGE5_9MICC|nr:ABC transporter ATP-binding protein [Arthrobacter mobilis]NKX55905.1 ABC transporter ATP-binding protein [Arthrobacter mobilis]